MAQDTGCVQSPQVTVFCHIQGAAPCSRRAADMPPARVSRDGKIRRNQDNVTEKAVGVCQKMQLY